MVPFSFSKARSKTCPVINILKDREEAAASPCVLTAVLNNHINPLFNSHFAIPNKIKAKPTKDHAVSTELILGPVYIIREGMKGRGD